MVTFFAWAQYRDRLPEELVFLLGGAAFLGRGNTCCLDLGVFFLTTGLGMGGGEVEGSSFCFCNLSRYLGEALEGSSVK